MVQRSTRSKRHVRDQGGEGRLLYAQDDATVTRSWHQPAPKRQGRGEMRSDHSLVDEGGRVANRWDTMTQRIKGRKGDRERGWIVRTGESNRIAPRTTVQYARTYCSRPLEQARYAPGEVGERPLGQRLLEQSAYVGARTHSRRALRLARDGE